MHIAEGVLSPAVLATGYALTAAGTALGLKKLDYDRLMTVAILAATFFVGSLIHVPIGKASFGPEKLEENLKVVMDAIVKAKPAAAKGQYIRSATVASTMGPGIKLNSAKFGG